MKINNNSSQIDFRKEFINIQEVYWDEYIGVYYAQLKNIPYIIIDRSRIHKRFNTLKKLGKLDIYITTILEFENNTEKDIYLAEFMKNSNLLYQQNTLLEEEEKFQKLNQIHDQIIKIYDEHKIIPYPSERETRNDDIDLVMLDANISGCVSTFLNNRYSLDPWRMSSLGLSYGTLMKILPLIESQTGQVYFQRLGELCYYVLLSINIQSYSDDEN